MRNLVYYVASTLDGFIAAPDDSYDGFSFDDDYLRAIAAEYPETLPTALGIDAPAKRFDTVIMGRRTYDPGPRGGAYQHLRQYVVSSTLDDPGVTVVTDPVATVRTLKAEAGLDIWLCGGSTLAAALADEIDELMIKINPVIFGSGRPLFAAEYAIRPFKLSGTRIHDNGVIWADYRR